MFGGVGKSGSPISRWTISRPWASSLRALASTSKAVSVPISPMRCANFMPLSSHAERAQVALVGHPADADILNPRQARPMAKLVEKLLQRRRRAFRLHLDGAIVSVAYVALEAQLTGVPLGKEPEADALHVADDLRLEAAAIVLRFTRQSGVRERAGRDHDGHALWRVRNRLQRAADDRQIGLDQLASGLFGGGADPGGGDGGGWPDERGPDGRAHLVERGPRARQRRATAKYARRPQRHRLGVPVPNPTGGPSPLRGGSGRGYREPTWPDRLLRA